VIKYKKNGYLQSEVEINFATRKYHVRNVQKLGESFFVLYFDNSK
jgi:hypothetical protein